MNSPIPLLLAGAPAAVCDAAVWMRDIEAAGFEAIGVWCPSDADPDARESAASFAKEVALDAVITPRPDLGRIGAVLASLNGNALSALVAQTELSGVPVLVTSPLSSSSELIGQLSARTGVSPLLSLDAHPSLGRALLAVQTAEIGLLRSIVAETVLEVKSGDGARAARNTLGELLRVTQQFTGRATLRFQAHVTAAEESWTLLGQTDRDVVISLHVSCVEGSGHDAPLTSQLRLAGSHGWTKVDLASPQLTVTSGSASRSIPFGNDPRGSGLRRFAAQARGAAVNLGFDSLLPIAAALDHLASSARTVREGELSW